MTREGGCGCGAVRFTIDGLLRDVIVCHCRECRAAAGRAWAATAAYRRDLALVKGEGLRWRRCPTSEHNASRGVCERCHALVFWDAPGRDIVSLGVETLDDAPPLVVAAHIWVASDPGWLAPDDDDPEGWIPAYPQGTPPGMLAVRWV